MTEKNIYFLPFSVFIQEKGKNNYSFQPFLLKKRDDQFPLTPLQRTCCIWRFIAPSEKKVLKMQNNRDYRRRKYKSKNFFCNVLSAEKVCGFLLDNLQYYLRKGLKLARIRRAVKFVQKDFLKDFIKKITKPRSEANTEFELPLFKLFANWTFGKFIGNCVFPLTDNFNGYLALSNFSNFTTNTHGTPNTHFFMGTMVQIAPHQLHVFLPFNFEIHQLHIFFFTILKKKHEKTCIWCTVCICCEIRKIGQSQIPVKIISAFERKKLSNWFILISENARNYISMKLCDNEKSLRKACLGQHVSNFKNHQQKSDSGDDKAWCHHLE